MQGREAKTDAGKVIVRLATAAAWAIPITLALLGGVAAIMYFTSFVQEVGESEAIKRFFMVSVVAYPSAVFILKATGDDIGRLKAAFRDDNSEA